MCRYLVMGLLSAVAVADDVAPRFDGPFVADSLAFHVVHQGGPLAVTLDVTRSVAEPAGPGGIAIPHAVYWQLYDADERLVTHEYHRFDSPTEMERSFLAGIADAPAGVYQLHATLSPASGMSVDLKTDPAASFGLMPRRCRLNEGAKGQFAAAYLYVPEGLETLTLHTYAASITVRDTNLEVVGEADPGETAEVAVEGDRVYGVEMAFDWENSAVGISGAPPILCPDEETARRIGGSLVESADGRRFPHAFQARMHEWMQRLTPADLRAEPIDLLPLQGEWLKDPRNAGLLGVGGPFTHIPRILQDQDLDPASETYGLGTNTEWMAAAYVIDEPFNPYRRKPEVLNRILLHEFAQLLKVAENGTFNANDWDHYSGVDGLMDAGRFFQYGYVAPHIDEALASLWLEGIGQFITRWPFDRVSCENQTSARMWNLEMLHTGSGDEIYRDLARDFAESFYDAEGNSFFKTGYHQERYGPDATYNGLCASNQAVYYRTSGDERAREGLRRTYDLFNHTVAPEPDGSLLGASNFSHRTSGSWAQKQWNAGVRLMAGELPEAGVWYADEDPEEMRAADLEAIATGLRSEYDGAWYEQNMRWVVSYAGHPWTGFFTKYLYPPGEIARGAWPVMASERFTRNVNDEFVFVRRPGYYATVYTGDTSHEWVRASVKPEPLLAGWEMQGGVLEPMDANARKLAWQPTQGLSMFWTPGHGSCVLGANWSVYTAQMVRADLPDGKVSWPDYWALEREWDAGTETLTLRHQMFDLPIATVRTMAFEESGLRQTVNITREAPTATERLVEQIPYVKKPGSIVLFRQDDEWVEAAEMTTSEMWIGGESGEGVRFSFGSPEALRMGVTSRNHGFDLGLVEVDLGESDSAMTSYVMQAAARSSSW